MELACDLAGPEGVQGCGQLGKVTGGVTSDGLLEGWQVEPTCKIITCSEISVSSLSTLHDWHYGTARGFWRSHS